MSYSMWLIIGEPTIFVMQLRKACSNVSLRFLARHASLPASLVVLIVALGSLNSARAQGEPQVIGRISGDDVTVAGALRFDSDNGQSTAVLGSGNEVTVRSGQAHIQMVEGGEIIVCGPAHFSVLKSGEAITLALDYGRVHPMLDASVQLTIFTPLLLATPVAINRQPRDVTIGLDQSGTMCALPAHGALRIEQQLTSQSVLVPEGGAANLTGGQLGAPGAAAANCGCEIMVSRNTAPKQLELSVPVQPSAAPHPAVPPPALTEPPVYTVYMPALTFDAKTPEMPPLPDPQTILLAREARLAPEVVFRGRVEAATVIPPPTKLHGSPKQAKAEASEAKKPGLFARLFGIFQRRRLHAPCAGVGCTEG
jgi:hypothetical protein